MSSAGEPRRPAAIDPVASLMVDVSLAHLDRPFDYLVPEDLDTLVQPGSRVRVRFAGRLVDGYVLARGPRADGERQLSWIERVLGEPVLTPPTTALFRAVADRWAGSFVDVVRLGVPARHARAEQSSWPAALDPITPPPAQRWSAYQAGPAFLRAVEDGKAARAVWAALPDEDWPARLAELLARAVAAGRGALAVVPDARDLSRLEAAVAAICPRNSYVSLSADLGPSTRYRRWLAVRRGDVRLVIGTRAAVYAPVHDLGLVAIWDDGDDLYAEPRAPYAHARDVLALRSAQSGAAALVAGFACTAEAAQLVATGWARPIQTPRDQVRAHAPRIAATGDDFELARDRLAAAARLPALAFRACREAIEAGRPVLVQVPRRGYVPSLACARDRLPARCPVCSGPLAASSSRAVPACRWCGRPAGDWRCPGCGQTRLRAVVVGSARTAEELGRAFPGIRVITSGRDRVVDEVSAAPALVVSTPGAEPTAADGYGAALLLDGWAMLSRADLRASEETLRRWFNAAALVRPGGSVVVNADPALAVVQALIRWDPVGAAERELSERAELGFPPAARMAALTGPGQAVRQMLELAALPVDAQVFGPVAPPAPARGEADQDDERLLIRVAQGEGIALARALKAAASLRSARKNAGAVRTQLDPAQLG